MKLWRGIILFLVVLAIACSENEPDIDPNQLSGTNSTWIVDTTKMTGTSLTDAFPLVDDPLYSKSVNAPWVASEDEKAVVFKIEDGIFIYPINLMSVEVVNDSYANVYFAVTYCPKTETSYVINRKLGQDIHTFKASGVLYQDNLVFYDLESGSFWSQMLYQSISGPNAYQRPDFIPSFEMSYNTAVKLFPEAMVLTGFAYSAENLKSTVAMEKPAGGDVVMGFLTVNSRPGTLSVLNINQLPEKGVLQFDNLLIVYNRDINFIKGFVASPDRKFKFYDDFPIAMKDDDGNTWDAFGVAVSGPAKGEKISGTVSFLAFWWAWQGIYETFYHFPAD